MYCGEHVHVCVQCDMVSVCMYLYVQCAVVRSVEWYMYMYSFMNYVTQRF